MIPPGLTERLPLSVLPFLVLPKMAHREPGQHNRPRAARLRLDDLTPRDLRIPGLHPLRDMEREPPNRTAADMYPHYADSLHEQRRSAKQHGGSEQATTLASLASPKTPSHRGTPRLPRVAPARGSAQPQQTQAPGSACHIRATHGDLHGQRRKLGSAPAWISRRTICGPLGK